MANENADDIYIRLVSRAGLFGKAFFGHRKTKKEARKLKHLWKMAQSIADKQNIVEVKEG